MRLGFGRPLLLAASIGIYGTSPAGAGFVEAHVTANGGCRFFGEQLGWEIRGAQPFGRPLASWEPRDVNELEAIGLSCMAGPPPIMPNSPGARFKRAVADFRHAVDEARRLSDAADGERDIHSRTAEFQAQDRARQERDRSEVDDQHSTVTANQEAERRKAEAGIAERRAAMEERRGTFRIWEAERREREADSLRENERRTQQMLAERAATERQAEERARTLIARVRSALPRLKDETSTNTLAEITALRSEIGAIQNRTPGQLGSDLFILDTELMDASIAIQRRQAAQKRREMAQGTAVNERPDAGLEPSAIDGLPVTVRPGIADFGDLTVGRFRKCLANAPDGRTVTIRQDGHPNRYVIRSESRSDVSWAEFIVVASGGQAHVPEVRGYSAEYRNSFQTQDWRQTMPAIVRACAS